MRLVNQAGLNLIKKAENDDDPKSGYRKVNGFVEYHPYKDIAGIPTIGFGTIMYEDGRRVTLKDPPIGMARAFELLQYELHEKAEAVEIFVERNKLNLNDNQFSALCSLAYNCGVGAITNHDASMRSALLGKDSDKIKAAFRMWNKYTDTILGIKVKKVSTGLTARREREIILFFS